MRRAGNATFTPSLLTPRFSKGFSYQDLAATLAAKATGLLRSTDRRAFFPPFHVVVVSQHGTVVLECEVNKDGNVQRHSARRVRRSHFPATVFFTDRSCVTRTFQILRRQGARNHS
jgi:hypothetical protein